jgi:hypothetical protein
MTPATLPGFLNKKEIEANYGRSYRSLTRDITRAVKSADTDILQHLKLVTDDDTVREGTDITLEMIQELSNNGLRPMWLAEETWVAEWIARRSGLRQDKAAPIQTEPEQEPIESTKKFESPAVVQLLQQRNIDLAKQNELLVGQLKIKDDQIRAANQQAEQSQQLMRDLHVLLKNVQDGLLGEGSRRLITPPKKSSSQPQQPVVVQEKADALKSRSGRSIKSFSKKTTRKRSPSPKPAPVQPPTDRFSRWFPTFLGSNRRRKK